MLDNKLKHSFESLIEPVHTATISSEYRCQMVRKVAIIRIMILISTYKHKPTNRPSTTDHSKMMNESVKKSLEKSTNVLEEKRKIVKRKICIKKDTRLQ